MTDPILPPANGTDQRLDLILDELRALRGVLAPAADREREDGTIELREPAAADEPAEKPARRKR